MFYDPEILKQVVAILRTERDAQTFMRILIERMQLAYIQLSSGHRGSWRAMFIAELRLMAQVVGHASTRNWVMSISETYSTIMKEIMSTTWFASDPSLVSRCVQSIQIHWPAYEANRPDIPLVAHVNAWWIISTASKGFFTLNFKRMIDKWRSVRPQDEHHSLFNIGQHLTVLDQRTHTPMAENSLSILQGVYSDGFNTAKAICEGDVQ